MMKIGIEGLDKTIAHFSRMNKQVRFATAVALTRTAKDVEKKGLEEFRRVFDRPTPFTMRSLRTKPAKPADLTAEVFVKDKEIRAGVSSATILAQHFSGGGRIHKQLEKTLRDQGFISAGEFVAPGGAAKLDRYGNMNKGQIVQILSQIGVRVAGYDSSPTQSKRSRRNVQRAGVIFWSFGPNGMKGKPLVDKKSGISYGYTGRNGRANHLPRGAWIREGETVKPVLIVIKSPSYKRVLDLDAITAPVVAARFNKHFADAFVQTIATAR